MTEYQRCFVLLADGARPDVFQSLCEAGELPNCERIFKKQGRFSDAVTVFPSTTGPAYFPFLTGCFPGTCNVPGIRWFDKKNYGLGKPWHQRFRSYVGLESFLMNHDLKLTNPTLFEYFKQPVNIFSPVNKGSTFRSNKTKQSRIWYWYYAHLTDRWEIVDEAATLKLLQAIDEDADFAFVVFPGIDEYSHFSHPHHDQVLKAYRSFDLSLGRIISKLEEKKILDQTLIFVVSDHGLSQTSQHFGVASFLESKGIKTFYYPKIFKWNFDAASMVSGNGMIHLYFRDLSQKEKSKGWEGRMPFEQLEKQWGKILSDLMDQEAVDLMACQEETGAISVLSKRGRARIRSDQNKIYYDVMGSDPFGYPALPAVMTSREALEKTYRTDYPDGIVQMLQLFRSSRTGDCVISSKKGWDLRKRFEFPEHHSSHGGLIKEHMLVPFFANVPLPNIPMRTCDIFPTILKLMGRPIPEGIDGIPLL